MADPQPINITIGEQPVEVVINDVALNINAPTVLANAWPFGENPKRADGITIATPTVVDQVSMPGRYRVVKWLLLIADEAHNLGVSSEINAFMRGGVIEFTEYAIMGDANAIQYEIDFVVDGDVVRMMFTSHYSGVLNVNTMKIGMFN